MSTHTQVSSRSRPVWPALVLMAAALLTTACASAARQGRRSAEAGDWATAVQYYQRALLDDPDRPEYRIALERALINASRAHITAGRAFEAQQELSAALREFRSAAEYDPSNSEVVARAATL
ncbi:MAG: tetratricopeptide repeat protein [Vicinamibacterales bacterium]|jgi:tetratricopeptide (TPR) repeat protein|nr:tetratricopeptide repeat protein [Vicinamibacterales bacterium]